MIVETSEFRPAPRKSRGKYASFIAEAKAMESGESPGDGIRAVVENGTPVKKFVGSLQFAFNRARRKEHLKNVYQVFAEEGDKTVGVMELGAYHKLVASQMADQLMGSIGNGVLGKIERDAGLLPKKGKADKKR
jgi:hypothetical protein